MKFSCHYFFIAVTLFIIEAFIAAFVNDAFIRPFLGDLLVVILLYTFMMAFVKAHPVKTACTVLLIAYVVEISQFFHLTQRFGWGNSKIAMLLLGTSFSFIDMLMYTLGVILVIIIETKIKHEKSIR